MGRNFLTDITIAGAMLVARCGVILEHTVPNLLKWCDWVLIMVDNPNDETLKVVDKLKTKYGERIRVEHTGFPPATPAQEEHPRGLFHRFKPLQGPIRETVLTYFRNCAANGEKVDLLVWPDSDECFSDSFPELLIGFWNMPDKKAITMKPVDVFGDMQTIHSRSMTGHTRVFKPFPELTALPYRTACNYLPLTKADRIGSTRVLIHLASLTLTKRDWRDKHWKPNNRDSEALWRLPSDVRTMTPEEIREILLSEPDMTIEDYLRGGDKRVPMGVKNANNALKDTSEFLHKMGIKHWLAFGTCLHLYRDGKIDKFSWDNDFIMDGKDLSKFDSRLAKEAGFVEVKIKKDIPTRIMNGEKNSNLCVRTICLKKYGVRNDIDIIYESKCGRYGLLPKGRKRAQFVGQHPIEWFKKEKFLDFMGMKYLIPFNTEKYLESNYGKNWTIPKYCVTPWNKRACTQMNYEMNDDLYDYIVK